MPALLPVPASAGFDDPPAFALGADVGWLPEMEAAGKKFYDANGQPGDCLQILRDHGVNAIRLRVWVNPKDGWCGRDQVVALARRAAALHFRIMIDFHYSDWWADPGKQYKPAAWEGHDFHQLREDVYDHTHDILQALQNAGVTPEWVQVGNEITVGMLWPDGSTDNWPQLAQLINKGHDAVKAVFPNAKVILHVDDGYDSARFRTWFDHARENGARFDVIGMSLYPKAGHWHDFADKCAANLKDMAARYGKEVMIVEIGMDHTASEATRDLLAQMIADLKAVPNGKGTGIFYWEPEAYDWTSWSKGAWGDDGKPTVALDAYRNSATSAVSPPSP